MRNFSVAAVGLILGMLAGVASAVSPTEVDDFQDGTVENWAGGQVVITNMANGGPLGVGDRWIKVDSTNRLATLNTTQWIGDYQSAGVLDVEVDLLNPNAIPLDMRVVIFSNNDTRFTSTVAHVVPADNLWHSYTFSLREADLTNVQANGSSYNDTITNNIRLMFRYDASLGAGGTPFVGSMGLDNITAVVPEPATLSALLLLPMLSRRRR